MKVVQQELSEGQVEFHHSCLAVGSYSCWQGQILRNEQSNLFSFVGMAVVNHHVNCCYGNSEKVT